MTTLLEQIKERIEKLRQDVHFEETDPECRELCIKIWGRALTPEYMVERRTGHNRALDEVITLLPSIIQEVVEAIEESGMVIGYREGDAFKQSSKEEVLASLKEESK